MKSKLFDVNVYVIDGMVNVIFYKLKYSDAGDGVPAEADTTDAGEVGRVSLVLASKDGEEIEAIRYALDAEEFDNRPLTEWEEFDEWNTSDWFMEGTAPRIFREFYDGLEEYEPELTHIWETVPGTAEHVWSMDALRRCKCGAEYQLQKWRG